MVSTNMREKVNPKKKDSFDDDEERARPIDELCEVLKSLIRQRSKDIEDEFRKIDRGSYGELTPDLLYNLFKRFVSSRSATIIPPSSSVFAFNRKSLVRKWIRSGRVAT